MFTDKFKCGHGIEGGSRGGPSAQTAALRNTCILDADGGSGFVGLGGTRFSGFCLENTSVVRKAVKYPVIYTRYLQGHPMITDSVGISKETFGTYQNFLPTVPSAMFRDVMDMIYPG
ncbi:hypothetical protein NQ315_001590 [Exocentrus adspersus]|uniref:Uncharacterized protein n=1 Tax=Exocentrus adspersus TaxID=1586481 RepID=A0AAV8W8P5_9CUCU|nr:hypothetical protein NQ315_001590 [Exocentrus adspersus]